MADIQKYGRTENLYNSTIEQGTISSTGEESDRNDRVRTSDYILLTPNDYTISFSANSNTVQFLIFRYDTSGNFIERFPSTWTTEPYTFTVTINSNYRVVWRYSDDSRIYPEDIFDIMLNAGTTALPYQPYIGFTHSLKKFDGTNWIDASVKEYDGTNWQ